jgi:hypothetical protein
MLAYNSRRKAVGSYHKQAPTEITLHPVLSSNGIPQVVLKRRNMEEEGPDSEPNIAWG